MSKYPLSNYMVRDPNAPPTILLGDIRQEHIEKEEHEKIHATDYQEAWAKFCEDNPQTFEGETSGQYLENRLRRAFNAGIEFGAKQEMERILEKFTAFIEEGAAQ